MANAAGGRPAGRQRDGGMGVDVTVAFRFAQNGIATQRATERTRKGGVEVEVVVVVA
jgi:hypothetical protein